MIAGSIGTVVAICLVSVFAVVVIFVVLLFMRRRARKVGNTLPTLTSIDDSKGSLQAARASDGMSTPKLPGAILPTDTRAVWKAHPAQPGPIDSGWTDLAPSVMDTVQRCSPFDDDSMLPPFGALSGRSQAPNVVGSIAAFNIPGYRYMPPADAAVQPLSEPALPACTRQSDGVDAPGRLAHSSGFARSGTAVLANNSYGVRTLPSRGQDPHWYRNGV